MFQLQMCPVDIIHRVSIRANVIYHINTLSQVRMESGQSLYNVSKYSIWYGWKKVTEVKLEVTP